MSATHATTRKTKSAKETRGFTDPSGNMKGIGKPVVPKGQVINPGQNGTP